jgi:hypothetical protein
MKVWIVIRWIIRSITLVTGLVLLGTLALGGHLPPHAAGSLPPLRQEQGDAEGAAPASETPADSMAPAGQGPRRVKVNFFINSIRNIDDSAGSYDIDMYLDLYWNDRALQGQTVANVGSDRLWNPYLDVTNAQMLNTLFEVYDDSLEADTNIRLSYRLIGNYLSRFDLRKFPFDQQTLSIDLGSFQYDSSQALFDYLGLDQPVVHTERPYIQTIPLGRHVSPEVYFEEWTLNEVRIVQQIDVVEYDKSSWSKFQIQLVLTRHAGAYLWKIVLILVLLMILAWGILLIDLQTLQFRLLVLFTLLLATVTFDFTTLSLRPRLAYLTFIDLYFISAYVALMLIGVIVLLTPFLLTANRIKLAERVNRLVLLLYPLLLVGVNGALFWYGLS